MPIQLAIVPSLQISASQFTDAWNADERTQDLASAVVQPAGDKSYDSSLGEVVLLLTTEMPIPVSGSALYDLIKDVLIKQGVSGRIDIALHDQADGGELLVVTPGEQQ